MGPRAAWLAVALLMTGTLVAAQEPAEEEARPEPELRIRVLDNPYDLASFYRSDSPSSNGRGNAFTDPYSIASYYRGGGQRQGHPYEPFWIGGYGAQPRDAMNRSYRRRIGRNGDLFLLAPTFLAPVGPLSGYFSFER